jgi:hypothetical protein
MSYALHLIEKYNLDENNYYKTPNASQDIEKATLAAFQAVNKLSGSDYKKNRHDVFSKIFTATLQRLNPDAWKEMQSKKQTAIDAAKNKL